MIADLSQWWNLVFVAPFGLGALLAFASVLGTGKRGKGGKSAARVGAKGGVAAHGHAARHLQSASGKRGAKTGKRGKSARDRRGLSERLHVQNIPPVMLAQNFCLFWGVLGWTANQLLAPKFVQPARFIVPAMLMAGVGALFFTLATGTLLSRFTPQDETSAVYKSDLVGRAGEAAAQINARVGSAHVRDCNGTLHQLAARTRPDSAPIPRNAPVLIVDYDAEGDFYLSKAWDEADAKNEAGRAPP